MKKWQHLLHMEIFFKKKITGESILIFYNIKILRIPSFQNLLSSHLFSFGSFDRLGLKTISTPDHFST